MPTIAKNTHVCAWHVEPPPLLPRCYFCSSPIRPLQARTVAQLRHVWRDGRADVSVRDLHSRCLDRILVLGIGGAKVSVVSRENFNCPPDVSDAVSDTLDAIANAAINNLTHSRRCRSASSGVLEDCSCIIAELLARLERYYR